MAQDSRQFPNVGNFGDVCKHIALIALLQATKPISNCLLYVETHAFRPTAPIGKYGWELEKFGRTDHPSVKAYKTLEARYVAAGNYLCSTGIASEMLNNHESIKAIDYILCEESDESRELLRSRIPQAVVLNDNKALNNTLRSRPRKYDAVVALIDPFTFDQISPLFSEWLGHLEACAVPEAPVAAIVFSYSSNGVHWPNIPGSPLRFTSRFQDGPYCLALYSSNVASNIVEPNLTSLGWESVGTNSYSVPHSPFHSFHKKEIRLPDVSTLIGVDLAWWNGQTGYSLFRPDQGIMVPEISPIPTFEETYQQILADTEANAFSLVAIDAPLLRWDRPQPRPWEDLFRKAQFHPLVLSPDNYRKSNGYKLMDLLVKSGFRDVVQDLRVFKQMLRGGRFEGKWFLETYPSPTVASLDVSSRYKLRKEHLSGEAEEARRRDSWPDLCCLYRQLRDVLGPLPFELPNEVPDCIAHKIIEDNVDALVCLFICMRVVGMVNHNRPLYVIGGGTSLRNEGYVITQLSPDHEQRLAYHDESSIMECFRPGFNEPNTEQEKVINCEAQIVRVIARAGTGKTSTMIWRAERIVVMDPTAQVLMLTFTRNAANQMRDRLDQIITAESYRRRCYVNTYHGFAYQTLLGAGIEANGWTPDKCILMNEIHRESVLDLIAQANGWTVSETWQDKLTSAINNTRPVGRLEDLLHHCPQDKGRALSEQWEAILNFYREEGLLDFDVIMVLNEYLLRTDSDYRRCARAGFTHIIADEFQDTNWPQLESLLHLAALSMETNDLVVKQLVVVGDDFQTIYSFRGAIAGVFDEVLDRSENNSSSNITLPLRSNWRSLPPIVSYANEVAEHLGMMEPHEKLCAEVAPSMEAKRLGHPCRPEIRFFSSICAAVKDLITVVDPDEVLVLAWKNDTIRQDCQLLRLELESEGVNTTLLSAKPSDMLGFRIFHAVLSIILSEDSPHLPSWWALARHEGMAAEHFLNLWSGRPTTGAYIDGLHQLGHLGQELARFSSQPPRITDIETARSLLASLERIEPDVRNERDLCLRLINELFGRNDSKGGFLRRLSEMTRRDFAAEVGSPNTIRLSTIHGYKGLESRAVVLHNDGFLDRESLELMRLDYVARTRARDFLYVVDGRYTALRDEGSSCPDQQSDCPEGSEQMDESTEKWEKTGNVWTNMKTGEQRSSPPSKQHLPENLRELLEALAQHGIRTPLQAVVDYLGSNHVWTDPRKRWRDLTNSGASNFAQAHVTKPNGQLTSRWDNEPEEFKHRVMSGKGGVAGNLQELKSKLEEYC